MQNQASQQGLQCEVAQDARHAQSQDADLARKFTAAGFSHGKTTHL